MSVMDSDKTVEWATREDKDIGRELGKDWLVPVHLFLDKIQRKHDNRVFSGRGAAWKRT